MPVPQTGLDLPERALARGMRIDATLMVDVKQPVVAGAVVQVLCMPGSFGCTDATPPLAEAVSGPAGDVHLVLPDPARP
jgi:hypothetical protein